LVLDIFLINDNLNHLIMILLWIVAAALIGFAIAAIFAGILKLRRNIFLLFYIPSVAVFFISFIIANGINVIELISHNWYWGLAGALIAGGFVIKNVFSQPSSERHSGLVLLSDVLWPGFAYGLTDSLLLSVLPVLSVALAFTGHGLGNTVAGKFGFGAVAMLASLIVTTLYHLGYPEFRGKEVIWPNIGNGVMTLAYLLTMNPLAAILPHIAMHIAAMIHGRETTGQVPPHYNRS
jgi:hypothetical protein